MAVSLTHATVATGTDAENGEIRKAQWNEGHTLTAGANTVLARAAATGGAVSEVALSVEQLLGRGATGDIAAITLGANLTMTGTELAAAGGSPGGSSGQLQYNDGSAFAGMAGTAWDNTTRSLTITGATVTANAPVLDLSQTWDNAAVTFTGLRFNVTNTASNASSFLLDIQLGGSSRFSIERDQRVNFGPFTLFQPLGSNNWFFRNASRVQFGLRDGFFMIRFGIGLGFGSADQADSGTVDVQLFRDAADTLAQRRGTNAQTSRIYNTFTDASNYERGFLKWNSNVLEIGTEAAGTGTNRRVDIISQGVTYQFTNIGTSFTGGASVYHSIKSSSGPIVGLGGGNGSPAFGFVGTIGNGPFQVRTNNANRLVFDTIGSVEITTALTVATLPGTPVVGMMARVTDADSPAVGSTVVGSGAAAALVWYNGTNWTVIGV